MTNADTFFNFGVHGKSFRFLEYTNTVGSSDAAPAIAIGGKLRDTLDED